LKPLVQLWEPGEARAGHDGGVRDAAGALRDHDDAWIRECAAFVAASLDGGELVETLATLPLMERILFLSQVGLFSDLPPADLKQIAAVAGEQSFHDGAVLARQDQPGEDMFIIVSGAVRVLRDGQQIAVRQRGEHIGELAILTGEPRSASLVAEGETRTLVVDRPHFESIRTLAARLEERS
jgi:CRP-like cAMP-binding protein